MFANNDNTDSDSDAKEEYFQQQIEELENKLKQNANTINTLTKTNNQFTDTMERVQQSEKEHFKTVSKLEGKIRTTKDMQSEIARLRHEQHSTELHKLDSKATEIELTMERAKAQQLYETNNELQQQLSEREYEIESIESILDQYYNEKIKLVQISNQEIDKLRLYLKEYKQAYDKIQNQ